MNAIVRNARANDLPAVYKLLKEFSHFQKTPEKLLITPEQLFNDAEEIRCLVLVNKGEIIGFASYYYTYYSWSGKGLYLDDLYVDPIFRGKGYGKQLLEAVIKIARDLKCKRVRWQVSKWNEDAISFTGKWAQRWRIQRLTATFR